MKNKKYLIKVAITSFINVLLLLVLVYTHSTLTIDNFANQNDYDDYMKRIYMLIPVFSIMMGFAFVDLWEDFIFLIRERKLKKEKKNDNK